MLKYIICSVTAQGASIPTIWESTFSNFNSAAKFVYQWDGVPLDAWNEDDMLGEWVAKYNNEIYVIKELEIEG